MALHPAVAQVFAGFPAPPPGPVDPAVLRAEEESRVASVADRQPLALVRDLEAQTPTGWVPVRIYTPDEEPTHGVVVYFHGGAFFLGSLESHDHVCRALALATGLVVVAVDYRRAPEAAFPAALLDSFGVVRWVAEGAGGAEVGWDYRTLVVAGDSAGATIATVVAATAHDEGLGRITHQVLYYPSVDLDLDEDRYASLRENAVGYGVETAGLRPYNQFYLESGADPADPRVSPTKRADLAGLPPALVVTAEFDPLRDEGEMYAARLQAAGVPCVVSRYAGAPHGFVQHFSWIPEFQRVFEETRDFVNATPGA